MTSMRKLFAIISALITGGLGIAMTNATQLGFAAASNDKYDECNRFYFSRIKQS